MTVVVLLILPIFIIIYIIICIHIWMATTLYKHKIHHAVVNMNNYSNNKEYLLSFLYINLNSIRRV